jgi:hypothetical protein
MLQSPEPLGESEESGLTAQIQIRYHVTWQRNRNETTTRENHAFNALLISIHHRTMQSNMHQSLINTSQPPPPHLSSKATIYS